MIKKWVEEVQNRFEKGLPGHAQISMAPANRSIRRFEEQEFPTAKKASVLVLVYPKGEELYTVVMQRPDYDGVHSSQVSFPGGKEEPEDDSPWHTAVRESEEEVGVVQQLIHPVLPLSPLYIPPSDFFVRPFLAYALERPEFIIDTYEVSELMEFPINKLLDDTIKGTMEINRKALNFKVPCYNLSGKQIWGATAIILSELEAMLKLVNSVNESDS